jgi:hypothetical protein
VRSLLLELGVTLAIEVRISWKLATSSGARTRTPPPRYAAAISDRVELLVSVEEALALHEAGAQLIEDAPDPDHARSLSRH